MELLAQVARPRPRERPEIGSTANYDAIGERSTLNVATTCASRAPPERPERIIQERIDRMPQRPLGDTGVNVNPVGLGCMSFAGFYGASSETEAFDLLARALDLGVDFWDTANIYGDGLSESRIGKFLAQDRGRRAKITLATKFSIRRLADGSRTIDNSEDYMIEALDASLKRLGVDHVDLYYVHRLDSRRPIEETVAALGRQVKKGKIRGIGLSEMAPDTLRRAHAVHKITAMQSEYSLWTRSPELGMIQALPRTRRRLRRLFSRRARRLSAASYATLRRFPR